MNADVLTLRGSCWFNVAIFFWLHWGQEKWLPYCKRHFHIYPLDEFSSIGTLLKFVFGGLFHSLVSDNGLLNGQQPIIWSTDVILHTFPQIKNIWILHAISLKPMCQQAGKLNFFGTRLNWVVSYIAYAKFHSPRPVFHSPGQIFARIGERASASFPACV